VPRDIAIVADLSASHTTTASFGTSTNRTSRSTCGRLGGHARRHESERPQLQPAKAGPTWGAFMQQAGFGEMTLNSGYNPSVTPGWPTCRRALPGRATVIANLLRHRTTTRGKSARSCRPLRQRRNGMEGPASAPPWGCRYGGAVWAPIRTANCPSGKSRALRRVTATPRSSGVVS
jgi:hypothetical protein